MDTNTLTGGARDVLHQLFMSGPTLDGDLVSKTGRTMLNAFGLVERDNGWNALSLRGVKVALEAGMGEEKEAGDVRFANKQRETAQQIDLMQRSIAALILGAGGEVRMPSAILVGIGTCVVEQDGDAMVFRYQEPVSEEAAA